MGRFIDIIALASAIALSAISCAKESENHVNDGQKNRITITASLPDELVTKVKFEAGASVIKPSWEQTDVIRIISETGKLRPIVSKKLTERQRLSREMNSREPVLPRYIREIMKLRRLSGIVHTPVRFKRVTARRRIFSSMRWLPGCQTSATFLLRMRELNLTGL